MKNLVLLAATIIFVTPSMTYSSHYSNGNRVTHKRCRPQSPSNNYLSSAELARMLERRAAKMEARERVPGSARTRRSQAYAEKKNK